MRYQKGSFALNSRQDKAILSFVADSRYVTHSQLFEFTWIDHQAFDRRVFNWRIRRLVRGGLVRKQVLTFLNGQALYSISRGGIQALEQLGVYYLGGNLDREKDAHETQIPHALEVNNIRLALLRTQTLWRWVPESLIRVLNLSPERAYAKVYDGIAGIRIEGEFVDFAVEYERTLKSPSKYRKIREAIESEKRLHGFLYLVPTNDLLFSLMHEFWGTKRLVSFGLVGEFKQKAFDANVWAPNYRSTSLRKALLEVAALAKSRMK
jgi:hypothetical protein